MTPSDSEHNVVVDVTENESVVAAPEPVCSRKLVVNTCQSGTPALHLILLASMSALGLRL